MNIKEYETHFHLEETFWWFKGRRLISFVLLNKYFKNKTEKKILDAGCGTGINLKLLEKFGDVNGADISQEALKFCKDRGFKNLNLSSVENLKYPNNSFDIVTSFDVLYCVKNDFQALKEMYRVCKPGAIILITSPAVPFLYSKLKTEHDLAAHTVRRYSKKEMKLKVKSAGFKIKRLTHMNMFLCPILIMIRVIKSVLNPNVKKSESKSDLKVLPKPINGFLFLILKLEAIMIKSFDLPFGLTLICVAQKPLEERKERKQPHICILGDE